MIILPNTLFNCRRNLISNAVLLLLKNWIHQKLNPSSRGWAYPHPLAHHADMPFGIRQFPSVKFLTRRTPPSSLPLTICAAFEVQAFSPFLLSRRQRTQAPHLQMRSVRELLCPFVNISFEPSSFAFSCVLGCLCEENCCRPCLAASIALVGINKELRR